MAKKANGGHRLSSLQMVIMTIIGHNPNMRTRSITYVIRKASQRRVSQQAVKASLKSLQHKSIVKYTKNEGGILTKLGKKRLAAVIGA